MRTSGWQIENMDMGTRRKVKAFAAANGLTIAEALTQLVDQALQAAAPANDTGNHKQSGTRPPITETKPLGVTGTGDFMY